MADNDYENYSDDDYLAELKDYVDAAKKGERSKTKAERRKATSRNGWWLYGLVVVFTLIQCFCCP